MAASDIIQQILDKSKMSRHDLGRALGLQGRCIITMYLKGKRFPGWHTWQKIIEVCKQNDIDITFDMMRENDKAS